MSYFDQAAPATRVSLDQAADGPHPYAWFLHELNTLPLLLPLLLMLLIFLRTLYDLWKSKAQERAYLRSRDKNSN